MENDESGIPVITLDDDDQRQTSLQTEQQNGEEVLDISSPKDFLIPTARGGKVFSPGPSQLESTTLDESVNDSYTQGEGVMKIPQACLESTRLSNNCAPGDFELETDLSKVQGDGDSRNPLNAGFILAGDNSSSQLPDAAKANSMESSKVVESDISEGAKTSDMENPSDVTKSSCSKEDLSKKSEACSQAKSEMFGQNDLEVDEEQAESLQRDGCLALPSMENSHNETGNSDPEVEQLMQLPSTVTELTSREGVKVYIVGTAHFSLESQEDVAKTIMMTRPRVVVVELCVSRLNILRFDEKTILEEAKNLNMEKIRSTIKQYGAVQGALYLLFLSTSAHLTRQLKMAPGGEFRRAWEEARNIPGCRIHLGDRPIHVTLHRALAALSAWQKIKLVWQLLLNRSPISAEDVERCKQKDLLEEMLEEMTGEFPTLSRVFVQERDLCLAHSLQLAATDAAGDANQLTEPPTVVGVVGIGHVAGIARCFGKVSESDVRKVMRIPPPSRSRRIIVVSFKLSMAGLLCYGCYKIAPKLPFNFSSIRQAIFSR